jgi:hypothetical protein
MKALSVYHSEEGIIEPNMDFPAIKDVGVWIIE